MSNRNWYWKVLYTFMSGVPQRLRRDSSVMGGNGCLTRPFLCHLFRQPDTGNFMSDRNWYWKVLYNFMSRVPQRLRRDSNVMGSDGCLTRPFLCHYFRQPDTTSLSHSTPEGSAGVVMPMPQACHKLFVCNPLGIYCSDKFQFEIMKMTKDK